ncbi:MAG: FlgD immunoglobulin-like domain containing protein [Deltaproteobacteria bacterium]|nr:FlgD immunoglobulin-like domain containing protein [Deltaproteobacteria bacterium]
MVTSVTSTTDTTAAAAAMKKSIGMNKDDFMKLLVAQLKYQDPLKPQDATAMLDQLSQLTLVEQSYNTNTALQNLLTSQNNSATMSSVSFIGKDVKANGNAIPFDGTSAASMQFNLSAAVDSAQIDISDSNGNVVRTISATALNQGDSAVSWDGRDSNGNLLSAGAYTFSVKGTTADGSTVIATTYTAGRIDGVSLVDGTPLLTIGAATISLSDVISVKGV